MADPSAPGQRPTMMKDMLPYNGLRGVCSMAIFLGHQSEFFLAPPWPGKEVIVGWEYLQAVVLFFLLSGIPLARLYSATGKVETWQGKQEFWRKRFARLAPIYYGTLLLNTIVIFVIYKEVDVRATFVSFLGCVFFLDAWWPAGLTVAGALWQVAVFVFGYAVFPFVSQRVRKWTQQQLLWGICSLWMWSAGLWALAFAYYIYTATAGLSSEEEVEEIWGLQLLWHVHGATRLPQMIAGMLLGQVVEQKRHDAKASSAKFWAILTDAISLLLVVTAIQAPIVQWYYGSTARATISLAFEALLLPLYAVWLAGIVLATPPETGELQDTCWTRRFLSLKPLMKLGDISLVLYCVHLGLLFLYTSLYAYITFGDWHLASSNMFETGSGIDVKVPYWHGPFQWILVLVISNVVSEYYEAPLRKILSGSPHPVSQSRGETAKLLGDNNGRCPKSGATV